jgi:hypothetical protein
MVIEAGAVPTGEANVVAAPAGRAVEKAASGPPVAVATCLCGAIEIALRGAPLGLYACHCDTCKRTTGSAFGYRARYAAADVVLSGTPRRWRRTGDAGRWVDHHFCGTCGAMLFQKAEALGEDIVLSVGALADADLPPPRAHFREEAAHRWLRFER